MRKSESGASAARGTGGQSFLDYDWKVGQTYRLMVTAKVIETRTEYSGYFYVPETRAWKRLVTFSTVTDGKPLSGYYSFIEDFKRDRVSATKVRQAHFGGGWVAGTKGEPIALVKARFTGDANPVMNINAGIDDDRFFLVTGGDTKNTGTKLRDSMTLTTAKNRKPPEGLPRPGE